MDKQASLLHPVKMWANQSCVSFEIVRLQHQLSLVCAMLCQLACYLASSVEVSLSLCRPHAVIFKFREKNIMIDAGLITGNFKFVPQQSQMKSHTAHGNCKLLSGSCSCCRVNYFVQLGCKTQSHFHGSLCGTSEQFALSAKKSSSWYNYAE